MIQALLDDAQELANMPVLKAVFAALWCWCLDMVGHPESAARWLMYLMLIDLVLGLSRAWSLGSFKGKKLTNGAFKFFRYWLAVAVFVMVDASVARAFQGMPLSLRDTFIAYLSINEAFSCIDHLAHFGMPIPEPFVRRLRGYRDAALGNGGNIGSSGNTGNGENIGDGGGTAQ